MYLYVNDSVFTHGYPTIVFFEKDKTRLKILNLKNTQNTQEPQTDKPKLEEREYIEFNIPLIHDKKYSYSGDFIKKVKMIQESECKYIFEKDDSDYVCEKDYIYALIRPENYPDSSRIFISSEDRDKVEVLKQFNYIGHGFSGEDTFINKMYFVRIHVPIHEDFHFYFSHNDDILYKDTILRYHEYWGCAKDTKTYIKLNDEKKKKYIELSEI